MDLSAREVLEQRKTTLRSLLESPGGPFGAQSGALGGKLAERWQLELRLIERVLDETTEPQRVTQTLDLWQERTLAFVSASESESPSWTDRQGHRWQAREVLEILEDLNDRLASWRKREAEGSPDAAPAAPGQQPAAKGRPAEPS